MAETCEHCGQPKATKLEQVDDKSGFCWRNPRACCETLPWRKKVADLSAQLASAQAELAERKCECEAWAALAFHVADKGGAIDCLRAEPTDRCFLFVGDWQSDNDTPGNCALWLASEMKLLPEPPKASET